MADTIREQIIQACITRAGIITVANGYNTDIGINVQRVVHNVDLNNLPASVIWPEPDEEVEQDYNVINAVMPLRIEGLAKYGDINPSVVSELILGDLNKAFLANTLAVWPSSLISGIIYMTGGTSEYPETKELSVGCFARFGVKYSVIKGDPYTKA